VDERRELRAFGQLLQSTRLTLKALAESAEINQRQFIAYISGEHFPIRRNRLKIALAMRKHAAKMLVAARMIEESVKLDPSTTKPGELFDRLGVPHDFSREEARIYQDVLQLEVDYRKSFRGEYQMFVGQATRHGFTFQQAAKFWHEKKKNEKIRRDHDSEDGGSG
jgi:hypothetical protein